jgi:hypothetical protein
MAWYCLISGLYTYSQKSKFSPPPPGAAISTIFISLLYLLY